MSHDIPFIGRRKELAKLTQIAENRVANLIVLKGRRRIGKTRLAEEFGKKYKTLIFTGLPPTKGMTAQLQRDHFASQLARQLLIPTPRSHDWNDLFWALAYHTKEGRVLIVFDEVSWIGINDPTFLGKLKTAWDTDFKKNSQLILMLTGSVSSWIEKNILGSTGFVGRISLDMTLNELPLYRCDEFWQSERSRVSAYEKFKLLSVTGGVPRYLEEMIPSLSAEENIRRLCFQSGGLLVNEYRQIFSDLFNKKGQLYSKIVSRLADGMCDLEEIRNTIGIERGGRATKYLYELETAGFISQDNTWHIKTGKISKLRKFRLKDNYLRFYLKYIEPNLSKIEQDRYHINPAQWPAIFGLQFENLVLNNRERILELLYIDPHSVICDNPYFQEQTTRHPGCQVDYLIQTRDRTLYLCEIKFCQQPVPSSVVLEVEKKMKAIPLPRGFSIRPILIHVNGVSDQLQATEFFSKTIDFSQLLLPPIDERL
jgi:AAA+ ATPase superfamily predicted ATPase